MRLTAAVPMLLAGLMLADPLAAQRGGRRPVQRPRGPDARPAPAAAAADDRNTSVELGVDGSYTRFDAAELNQIAVPSTVRVGFYLTPRISFEPSVAFQYAGAGDFSTRNLSADASLLWHLTGNRRTSQVYLRPFAGVLNQSEDDGTTSSSSTDFSAGGALGVKLPIVANRVVFRTDAFYRRLFADRAQNLFGVNFGLSLYAR